jgi:hypothetical protein
MIINFTESGSSDQGLLIAVKVNEVLQVFRL